jgi:DNA polymerase I-like protein with 3'-5' exonuclease and polymerase domains
MMFPRLHDCLLALDLETHDPVLKRLGPGWCFGGKEFGKIVGIALTWGDADTDHLYLPIRHETGKNFPDTQVLRWLKTILEDPSVSVVYHNGLYDRGWLRREGIIPKGKQHDTMVQAAVFDEYRRSYSLNACGLEYLGRGKNEAELKDTAKKLGLNPKVDLWRLPGDIVGKYSSGALGDSGLTWGIHHYLMPRLADQGLLPIYELEMRLQPVLIEMRARGVRVDLNRAAKVQEGLRKRERASVVALQKLSGLPVDLWANRSLGRAADKLGIEYPRTKKRGDPSFTKDWLAAQAKLGNKFAELVLAGRKASKTQNTFIEGHILGHQVRGRIHAQFHPLRSDDGGAVTGRYSSSDPNLQQLPNKEEEQSRDDAILVRGLFLPEVGQQWCSLDYSQQEPRLALHYADIMGVAGAREAVEMYRANPRTDFHQYTADLTGEPRSRAKILGLAVMYGKGGASLCHDLGLPTKWITKDGRHLEVAGDEGQAIIDAYHNHVPFLKAIAKVVTRRATKKGVLWTIGQRRRRFAQEYFNSDTRRWELKPETAHFQYAYKGFNALIQGGAADQIKKATVDAYEYDRTVPMATIHDENAVNSDNGGTMYKAMMEAYELRVPVVVDRAEGPNWGATL